MIRNIIFDIGKVLVSYEPDAYMDRLGLDEKAKAAIPQACLLYTSDAADE